VTLLSSGLTILKVKLRRSADVIEDRDLTIQSGFVPSALLLKPTATGQPVSVRSALQVPEVLACVRVLSDAAASLPLKLYRDTTGGRIEVRSGHTYDLLQRPAPATTSGNLIGTLVANLVLHGTAYLAKYRDADGNIAQLGTLSPERVFWRVKDGVPVYTITLLDGSVQQATPRDLIHLRGLSIDGYQGVSPVQLCADAIALSAAMIQHAGRYFQNDARPSGLLRVPAGPQADEQVENLRAAWEGRHSGAQGAHRIAVVTGEISFDSISMNPEQSQFAELRQQAVTQIARAFRVPPWMIAASDASSLTYSNAETQSQAFVDHSLRPWLTCIEQAVTADADLCMGSLCASFDFSHLLRGDSVARAAYYQAGIRDGWLQPAEARVMEGLPPLPAGATTPDMTVSAMADHFAAAEEAPA